MKKAFAIGVMVAFLVPNLIFIVRGKEDFPFTAAPMFAHYIGDHTVMYNFKFIGHTDQDSTLILPPEYGANNEMMSRRFFFAKVYGSVDCPSSFGDFCNDTPQKLEDRLSQYFTAYLWALSKNNDLDVSHLRRIDLEVWKLNPDNTASEKHRVGYYDTATQRFIHTWLAD